MPQDRRSFIKRFGVTLGSLIVSGSLGGCGPKKDKVLSDKKREVEEQNEPSISRAPQWGQLRQCWLTLITLKEDAVKLNDSDGQLRIEAPVLEEHRALLDTLVTTGQLDKQVAEHMQVAFFEAVAHIVNSMATCYFMLPIEYGPRDDLLEQADMLKNISADVDPATVAKVQAAITQDMAFFETFKSGGYGYNSREASPEALEAARLLTQLFLETPD